MSRRRGIHSESHAEEDETKQDLRKCYKSGKSSVENNSEHEPEAKLLSEEKDHLNPNLSKAEDLREDCDNVRSENKTGVSRSENKTVVSRLLLKLIAVITTVVSGLLLKLIAVIKNQISRNKNLTVVTVVGLLCLFTGWYYMYNHAEKRIEVRLLNQTQDEIDFEDELYSLGERYSLQEDRVWVTFSAGIKSVITEKPNKPSVFLLLHDNAEAKYTSLCIARDVIRAASKYLMKKELSPLLLSELELNKESILEDPGSLIVLHSDTVKRSGAMIVTNLEVVNPKVAAIFHYFCDRYSPVVEKAIYLFTLKLKEIPKDKLQKAAENELQRLWAKELPDNVVLPLITRLTGNVVKISNDQSGCKL